MKAIRLFGVALFTVLMSVGFSSCSKSDDDDINGGETSVSIVGTWKLISEKEYAWDYDNNKPDLGKNTYNSNNTGDLYSFSKNGKNLIMTILSSGRTSELFYITENEYYYVDKKGVKCDHFVIKELTKEQLVIHYYESYYKESGKAGYVQTYVRQ